MEVVGRTPVSLTPTPKSSWEGNFVCSVWVKRRMYSLEKFLGVSYEGFVEQEVADLFSAIESRHKGNRVMSDSFRKEVGSREQG